MPEVVRSALKKSPLFKLFLSANAWRTRRTFLSLLDQIPPGREPLPGPRQALCALQGQRRRLSEVPRVVAFGHKSWEQHGLWPSFRRLSEFSLVEVGAPGGRWSEAQRVAAGRRLLSAVQGLDRERPVELVFFYCGSEFIDPQMLRELAARGIWTAIMNLDDKHAFHLRRQFGMTYGQVQVAPLADLYWTTWRAGAHVVAQVGGRPWYAPEGADPEFHRPLELERDIEVLFLGARYGDRQRTVDYLRRRGFDVQAYGRGWPNGFVSFQQTVELFSRARVVLGVGQVGQMPQLQHLKGRDFEVPMCGALYLTSYNPELADWFDIGREVLCYSSLENCAETLHWILRRPDQQQAIRDAALARSLRQHTWEHRLRQMLGLLAPADAESGSGR
jgi:hypothetical protein